MFNTKQSNPAVSLHQPGDSIEGVIVSIEYRPEYTWANGKRTQTVRTDSKGRELQEAVITMLPDNYLHEVTLYVPGSRWRMVRAIQDAVKAAGASNLEEGGHLEVIRTGNEQAGNFEAGTYSARYAPFEEVENKELAATF